MTTKRSNTIGVFDMIKMQQTNVVNHYNTQQDLKIYCSSHYVRKTLQNLS